VQFYPIQVRPTRRIGGLDFAGILAAGFPGRRLAQNWPRFFFFCVCFFFYFFSCGLFEADSRAGQWFRVVTGAVEVMAAVAWSFLAWGFDRCPVGLEHHGSLAVGKTHVLVCTPVRSRRSSREVLNAVVVYLRRDEPRCVASPAPRLSFEA